MSNTCRLEKHGKTLYRKSSIKRKKNSTALEDIQVLSVVASLLMDLGKDNMGSVNWLTSLCSVVRPFWANEVMMHMEYQSLLGHSAQHKWGLVSSF
jgi:hypothetical protein